MERIGTGSSASQAAINFLSYSIWRKYPHLLNFKMPLKRHGGILKWLLLNLLGIQSLWLSFMGYKMSTKIFKHLVV